MTQWVQHWSRNGEKWEVREDIPDEYTWYCIMPVPGAHYLRLPKSEYCLCDPPEQWEDVTEHVIFDQSEPFGMGRLLMPDGGVLDRSNGRLRKVRCGKTAGVNNPDWAFIVERRKS